MEYVLKTNNLTKKYKHTEVLNNLNMKVEKGAIYGLIGKNGAGKTTLIRIITGLQSPTKGDYKIYGISHQDKKINKVLIIVLAVLVAVLIGIAAGYLAKI